MKKLLSMSALLFALAAMAQPEEQKAVTDRNTVSSRDQQSVIITKEKPGQINGKKVVYTGVAVQAIKSRNPLQLVNPAAGDKYGDGSENAVRPPRSERVAGLRLFAIEF